MKEGDKVVITSHRELGVFQFVGRAITIVNGKAELVGIIDATEGQELNGEKLEEVCIEEKLLEHYEGQEHEHN